MFLSGAAAYTGAVTHSLSIAVIVCETTGQLCALLPVLVSIRLSIYCLSQLKIYESIVYFPLITNRIIFFTEGTIKKIEKSVISHC